MDLDVATFAVLVALTIAAAHANKLVAAATAPKDDKLEVADK